MALVTEKIDGLTVEGHELSAEDRELQGRKLVLYRGPGTPAGGTLRLHLSGLPHNDPSWRLLAVAVALVLLLGVRRLRGARQRPAGVRTSKLEQQREHLLGELAALEKSDSSDKRDRKKQELTARLVRIYRELDELR